MKRYRKSNRRDRILELLSKPEYADGLTTKMIILALEPNTKIYDENGKLNRKSSEYKSWSRTLGSMIICDMLTSTKQKSHETVWKKSS